MDRYQPVDQVRDGTQMYGIVDTEANIILDKDFWFWCPKLRDACIRILNWEDICTKL